MQALKLDPTTLPNIQIKFGRSFVVRWFRLDGSTNVMFYIPRIVYKKT